MRKVKSIYIHEKCRGCGLCIAFCSKKVLEMSEDNKANAVHIEDCTACRQCELHCPDYSIYIE